MLKKLRQEAGLTQQALADATGINIRQIQKLESGEIDVKNITAANAIALADALNITVDTLLTPQKGKEGKNMLKTVVALLDKQDPETGALLCRRVTFDKSTYNRHGGIINGQRIGPYYETEDGEIVVVHFDKYAPRGECDEYFLVGHVSQFEHFATNRPRKDKNS